MILNNYIVGLFNCCQKCLLGKDLWRSIAFIFFTREKPKQKKAVHNSSASLNTQLYCAQEGSSQGGIYKGDHFASNDRLNEW